jgi:hypothetical protein
VFADRLRQYKVGEAGRRSTRHERIAFVPDSSNRGPATKSPQVKGRTVKIECTALDPLSSRCHRDCVQRRVRIWRANPQLIFGMARVTDRLLRGGPTCERS